MRKPEQFQQWPRLLWCLLLGAGGLLPGGCAGPGAARHPAVKDDLADFARMTVQSRRAVDKALASLDGLSATTNYPPTLVKAYQQEVDDVEVGSVRVRARAEAILKRGDVYFETWERHVAQMQDALAREGAEEQRPALLDNFHRIEALSGRTGDAFDRFLAGMRELDEELDQNPGTVAAGPTRALLASTQADGRTVEQDLDLIQQELAGLNARVKAINTAGKQ